jgi:hypothetical protein
MTGTEHYRRAEELIGEINPWNLSPEYASSVRLAIDLAQVHATLAYAAVILESSEGIGAIEVRGMSSDG